MKKETAVAAIIVAGVLTFVGGYMLGGYGGKLQQGQGTATAGAADGRYDSSILPIGDSPVKGSPSAPVTVVFFADFGAASSAAAAQAINQVATDDRFTDDMRLVLKVLPGRDDASRAAAAAALFAAEHGRLWDGVYEGLMAHADDQSVDHVVEAVQQAGLDPDEFRSALQANRYDPLIDADVNLARSLGAARAPAVFVNGRSLTGNDIARGPLREAVFGEREAATEAASTISADRIYGQRVRENAAPRPLVASRDREQRGQPAPQANAPAAPGAAGAAPAPSNGGQAEAAPQQARAPAQPPAPDVERMRVPVGDSPARGPDDALVTIVEFSDFKCPFCGRVETTLSQLEEEYGNDLRLVWKNNPLPMHPASPLAHEAALAAAAQGHFWEMHDRLFANQRASDLSDYEGYARDIGLNMDQFDAFVNGNQGQSTVDADQALATQVGARGTPHFFINGRRLRGAQPIESFREVIDSELALAHQLLDQGVARNQIYDHLMQGAQARATAQADDDSGAPAVVDPPPIGDAPTRGPADAPVTIYMFSEFQCPYCGRAQATLHQIEEQYGDQIRWVFKNFPLPFHENADLAAQAGLAANAQHHMLEMHDLLFQNQRALTRADLERYAQQIGLNMDEFRQALDSGQYEPQIQNDLAEGRRVGVSGTPTFIVGNERVVGALPFERFQPVIERHLHPSAEAAPTPSPTH